jgi:ABC-type Mn2+/Zn2+ transport system ATPase subunit
MTLLSLQHVSCGYGAGPVVEDVTLNVEDGDFAAIVGPSGGGKTTVLKAMIGALTPSFGRVERRPGLRVGYVPQIESVDWSFPVTVEEVVVMPLALRRLWPRTTAAERAVVAAALDRLGIGGLGRRHISELSRGQQQRVFLARAIVQRPELLLLDEPATGVDVRARHDLLHLLTELRSEGMVIVLTTHDLNGLASHLPRVICLNRTIIADGPPRLVVRPYFLERTFGAPLAVLEHAGLPIVVDVVHSHAGSPSRNGERR